MAWARPFDDYGDIWRCGGGRRKKNGGKAVEVERNYHLTTVT
jgi:hypothetical protein